MKQLLVLVLIGAVGGCAAAGLPYTPDADAGNKAPVSAGHQLTPDRLYVHVASAGFRVEAAVLVRDDGAELAPTQIHHPPRSLGHGAGIGTRIGVGAGVGSLGRGGGVGVSVGSGVATDYGQTVIVFPADPAGPGPWRLRVKIAGFPPAQITLPAITPAGG